MPYVWRNVEIVCGGFVSGIVFHPTWHDVLYARTDIGGAYRWNPRTSRWIPLNDDVSQAQSNLLGVESIAPDPSDANRVYAAVGTYTAEWAGNGAVLRSNNQGATWQRTPMPFKMGGNEDGRSMGERLAVDPNDGRILFIGSRNNGLWRSADRGATWAKVTAFPVPDNPTRGNNQAGVCWVVFDGRNGRVANPTQTVYAGVATPGTLPVYQSRDGGATWQAVPGQPAGLFPHHAALDNNGTLYVTYGNHVGPNGMSDGAVWKRDAGGQWTDISPSHPNRDGAGGFGYAGLAIDPAHPGTLLVTTMDRWSVGDTLYRTTNGGVTWIDLKPASVRDSAASPFLKWGKPRADMGHWMGALALDPTRPGHVLYGTGATIWGSDDANPAAATTPTHWSVRAQGLEETAVEALVSPPQGAHLLSGLGDVGGFRHDDLTVSPRAGMYVNPQMSTTTGLDFAEKAPLIVARVGRGGSGKHGALSRDGGTTWTPLPAEPSGAKEGGSVAVSSDGATLVWAARDKPAFRSPDGGATWAACAGLPPQAQPIADRNTPSTFYAFDPDKGAVYVSNDSAATFTLASGGLPTGRGQLRSVPGRAGELWLACGDRGLFRLTGGGKSFARVAGVESGDTVGFGVGAEGKRYPALYLAGKVGGVAGVFRSDDTGASWSRINDDAHQWGWIGHTITGDPRLYGRVYLGDERARHFVR